MFRKKAQFTYPWGAMFRVIKRAYTLLTSPVPEGYVSANIGTYVKLISPSVVEGVAGASVVLTANVVRAVGEYTLQWYKDGVILAGQTGATYTVPSGATTAEADYSFTITDTIDTAPSTNILSVTVVPVIFTGYDIAGSYVELSDITLEFTQVSTVSTTYQWYLNGILIGGATQPQYSIADAPLSATGIYTCIVSNIYGSRETTAQYVQIVSQEAATAPMVDLVSSPMPTANAGESLVIAINSATGTTPLTYSWQKLIDSVWTEISTFAGNLTIANSTTANSGSYRLVLTNGLGTATSDVVTATVFDAPVITFISTSREAVIGTEQQLRITAKGAQPKNYEWQKFVSGSWSTVQNGTTTTYVIANFQAIDAGEYRCIVTNSYGSATSSIVELTDNPLVVVWVGTYIEPIYYLGSHTRTIAISGPSPYTVAWQKETFVGSGIWTTFNLQPGVVSSTATYTFNPLAMGDSGSYRVVVENEFKQTSLAFTLNVLAGAVLILPAPTPTYGSSELIPTSIVSNAPATYQWYKNDIEIGGATSQNYTIPSVLPAGDGDVYKLIATNSGGTFFGTYTQSGVAIRFVSVASISATAGDNVSVSQSFEAYGTPTYTWRRDATPLGTTTAVLNLNPIVPADAGNYYLTVTNEFGTLESPARAVSVANLVITTQPATTSSYLGGTVGLLCQATGPGTISYQWYKNTVLMSGKTSQDLIFNDLAESDSASYYCIVTNQYGSLQSATAVIAVVRTVSATVDYVQPAFVSTVNVTVASTVGLVVGGIIYVPNQSRVGANPVQSGAGFYAVQVINSGTSLTLLPSTPPSGGEGFYVAPAGATVFGSSTVSLGGLTFEVGMVPSDAYVNLGGLTFEVGMVPSDAYVNLGGLVVEVGYVP